MQRAIKPIIILSVIAVLFAAAGAIASREPEPMYHTMLADVSLQNPHMEDGFRYVDGVGELQVGNGWQPWYHEAPGWFRPEYKPETVDVGRGRVYEGQHSQKLFTTYAKHDAGIYQEVYGVSPGQWYTFEATGWQWSSQYDNPDTSEKNGKCSLFVGINPWGDARALYRTTVWGEEALNVYDQWVTVDVTSQAWTDKIVVFVRHTCEYPVKHNDLYVEGFKLEAVDLGQDPPPTYTPLPTYTPVPPDKGGYPTLDQIRQVVREEIDKTKVYFGPLTTQGETEMEPISILIAALVVLIVLVAVAVGLVLFAKWLLTKEQGYPNELAIEAALKPYLLQAIALAYKGSEQVMDEVGHRLHEFNKKALADLAYDLLPDDVLVPVGGGAVVALPVGIVKQLVSREKWSQLVQDAFDTFVTWYEGVHEDVGDLLDVYIEDMKGAE
jgi:hypothetical protein